MKYYNDSNNFSVPDSTIFNSIRQGKSSLEQALSYYQALDKFVNTNYASNPQWQIALDQFWEVERILKHNNALSDGESLTDRPKESAPEPQQQESPETTRTNRSNLTRSYQQKSAGEIKEEILAAATDKEPKLALTKVAAANSIPLSRVEALATTFLKDQGLESRYDLEKDDYKRCIAEIREIELKEDPGEKEWKLLELARRHNRSKKEMLNVYYQSLLAQSLEDPISLDEFRKTTSPNMEWLLRGWIPEAALILLHGHGGLGKTLFVHHLIKHVVRGVDWGEYKASTGRNGVLYIQTDTPLKITDDMLKQAGLVEDNLPIVLHGSWKVEYISYLYRWIQQQRPALVIIDSLTSVNRSNTVSENDTTYAQPILLMKDMAAEFGCSFFIIHHSNGAGEVRGTKAIRAAVDAVWRLEAASKDESDPKRVLVMEKFRGRACGRYQMKFDDEDFTWDLLEPLDENGNSSQNSGARHAIVSHLSQHRGVRFCSEDLAHALDKPEATIRRELSSLVREGAIEKQRNPDYAPRLGNSKFFYSLT
ncbi:hypothetical protein C7B80_10195 [Cyanosarcina cf. burmensis CCALA 770]|nr:hypothetical protein C7B80_10195 [Cyanosarcina cf. burmensis CCALA 770]